MEIKLVTIQNYRSIKLLEVPFDEIDNKQCSIFLGKNESGKSNILKALSLLNGKRTVDYKLDCYKDAKKKMEDISIIFDFKFNKRAWDKNIQNMLNLTSELINVISIKKHINIKNNNQRSEYFQVDIEDNEHINKYVINPQGLIVELSKVYNGTKPITEDNIHSLIPSHTLLTKARIEALIKSKMSSMLEQTIPQVIYWEPSSEYLINGFVNLTQFKTNPAISIPLKNIFHIANIDSKDINSRIDLIINDNEEREELEEILSDEITKYVNNIWPEHKISINVNIEQNMTCSVNVHDNDYTRPKYTMDQRSDGFKQFISILLNLSAENKASILKNKLILLDEPEVHLHPSGIRYLRDELLKISENNNLVIATHSIYMIDKVNLNRHFSITKDKSLTDIHQIEENNPYQEEVLYEALGTSIFELISPTMLIFEGKTDKDLFDAFSYKFRQVIDIKNISAISANSVDNIPKYVKFFNGELVKGYVIVDSDKAGRNVKKSIITDHENFDESNTFELRDLLSNVTKDMTLEDMLPKVIIEKVLLDKFQITFDLQEDKPYVEQIKKKHQQLHEKDLKLEILKVVMEDISKGAMTKEKTEEKYPVYFEFISNLYTKIHS